MRAVKLGLSIIGNTVWIIGLAGIPSDASTWAAWLPVSLLSNPAFYGPVGAIALYATYDLVLRDKIAAKDKDVFKALAHQIRYLAGLTSNPHHYQELRVLAAHLEELGIPTPDQCEIGNDEGPWRPFLEQLSVYASLGRLEKARRMRGERAK